MFVLTAAGCTTNWTTYHGGNARAGVAVAESLVPASRAWKSPRLDGAVYGEPLVLNHRVIVATENDSVYALDLRDGHILWGPRHVGTPVPQSWLPCGDIFPLGITSTPVIDPVTNTVYVVAERTTLSPDVVSHDVVALDALTGTVRWQHSIDPAAVAPLDRRNHQQRAALALANGRVYVAFGGLAGDCASYTGWVVSAHANGTGAFPAETYRVPTAKGGAIWGASGPAIDASGNIYVSTGNGASSDPTRYDHGNSVIKLSPTLVELDHFAPTTWAADSAADRDLGSTGPSLLAGGLLFQDGKNATAYLLDTSHLGGIGGQKYEAPLCHDYGGNAYRAPVVYVACTNGVRAVKIIGPPSNPSFTVLWHSAVAKGSPIVAGNVVWASDNTFGGSILYGLNATTGATIATLPVGPMDHFNAPTIADNRLLIATTNQVLAFKGPNG
jgi:outer membrane protein assembly factor BamB